MKNFAITTAAVAIIAATTPASANIESEGLFRTDIEQGEILGSDVIGARVYTSDVEFDLSESDGIQTEWEDVGEINDLVISPDGTIEAALVDIGGFLGIGERHVAMNMNMIKFVDDKSTEEPGDYFLVIPASAAALNDAPEYMRDSMHDTVATSTEPVQDTMQRDIKPMAGFDLVAIDELTAEELTGARVYSTNNQDIGEVSEILLDGTDVKAAVIDVGGFLGLGEKPVQLDMEKLQVLRESDSGLVRVNVDMTEDMLEALPEYEN